jgi:hypothetical protein
MNNVIQEEKQNDQESSRVPRTTSNAAQLKHKVHRRVGRR